jgi:hypothetical protein
MGAHRCEKRNESGIEEKNKNETLLELKNVEFFWQGGDKSTGKLRACGMQTMLIINDVHSQ